MVQIIQRPHNTRPTFGSQILEGLNTAGGMAEKFQENKLQQENAKNAQLQKQSEFDQKNAHELNLQERKFGHEMQLAEQKRANTTEDTAKKLAGENKEKLAPFFAGLDTIEAMKNIKNRGNIGAGSRFTGIFNEETRKDRAEYSRLGKSLISVASNNLIRNKAEFEALAEDLYDPSLTQAEMEGILVGMERIITQNMSPYMTEEQQQKIPAYHQRKSTEKPREKTSSLEDIWHD